MIYIFNVVLFQTALAQIILSCPEAAEGTYGWGGTDDGARVSTHAVGGSGGMVPQKNF